MEGFMGYYNKKPISGDFYYSTEHEEVIEHLR